MVLQVSEEGIWADTKEKKEIAGNGANKGCLGFPWVLSSEDGGKLDSGTFKLIETQLQQIHFWSEITIKITLNTRKRS